jgi:hypothetical protein
MKCRNIFPILLLLLFGLSACNLEYPIPTDGVWYCEELQAQFTFEQGDGFASPNEEYAVDVSTDYVIVNDDRIAATLASDRGATYVWIMCQELDHPDFDCGEIIYSFEFVSLSGTEYVLKDDAGKHYTFLRIRDTSTDD